MNSSLKLTGDTDRSFCAQMESSARQYKHIIALGLARARKDLDWVWLEECEELRCHLACGGGGVQLADPAVGRLLRCRRLRDVQREVVVLEFGGQCGGR